MTEEKNKTRSKRYEEINEKKVVEKEIIEKEENSSPLVKILVVIGLILVIFFVYSFHICPNIINVKEYKVESNLLPSSFDGIKIIHFSDIHYGTTINQKQLEKIVKKINETKPDIIVFSGDLIDKNIIPTDDIQKEIKETLKKLEASLYKYAVIGNEDDEEIFNKTMEEANFRVLKNESLLLYYKEKTPIVISGFNNIDSNPDYLKMNNKIDDINPVGLFNIVIFHESDAIDNVIDNNPSLILTSGTLGGKINIFKPLFLPETADKYYEDNYQINDSKAFITNGLGTTGVNIRFNNNPSFNLYRLYKEEN